MSQLIQHHMRKCSQLLGIPALDRMLCRFRLLPTSPVVLMCRENQDLEQNRIQMERQTAAIQMEKDALQQAALDLAQRLEAVIHDKFMPKSHIDADTPIDKTLNSLHAFVAVSFAVLSRTLAWQMLSARTEWRCAQQLQIHISDTCQSVLV